MVVRLVPSRAIVYLRRMSGGSPPRKTETTGTWLEALRKGYAPHKIDPRSFTAS